MDLFLLIVIFEDLFNIRYIRELLLHLEAILLPSITVLNIFLDKIKPSKIFSKLKLDKIIGCIKYILCYIFCYLLVQFSSILLTFDTFYGDVFD